MGLSRLIVSSKITCRILNETANQNTANNDDFSRRHSITFDLTVA